MYSKPRCGGGAWKSDLLSGWYTKLLAEVRKQAMDRMVQEAHDLGANAIIEIRFSASMVMQAAAELLAYGTAVVVEDDA